MALYNFTAVRPEALNRLVIMLRIFELHRLSQVALPATLYALT